MPNPGADAQSNMGASQASTYKAQAKDAFDQAGASQPVSLSLPSFPWMTCLEHITYLMLTTPQQSRSSRSARRWSAWW